MCMQGHKYNNIRPVTKGVRSWGVSSATVGFADADIVVVSTMTGLLVYWQDYWPGIEILQQ